MRYRWGKSDDFHSRETIKISQHGARERGIAFEDEDDDEAGRRILVLFCVDTSWSMNGEPLEKVNDALTRWCADLRRDDYYARSLEVALVTFGGDTVTAWKGASRLSSRSVDSFVRLADFRLPTLQASGRTPMGEALMLSLDIITLRKEYLKRRSQQYYRPLLWLVSDGEPTDDWEPLVQQIAAGEANSRLTFFAVGVNHHNPKRQRVLASLSPGEKGAYEIESVDPDELVALFSDSVDQLRAGGEAAGWQSRR